MRAWRGAAPKQSGQFSSQFRSLRAVILMSMLVMPALGTTVSASEFGIGTYRPGLMDLFAGYLAPPGTTLVKTYFLFQDAGAKAVARNDRFEAVAHTVTYTSAVFAAHVTSLRILGSYWGFGAIAQFRIASQSLKVGPAGELPPPQTSTIGGLGDLILLPVMLNWNWGQFHLMTALAFYAPTGSYDRQRIINIGTNRWAVEPDVGLTWMDEERGREASLFVGYTVNRENAATHYQSGDEFHADFVLAQHLANGVVLGVAGYAVQQTTADTGPSAVFGPFRGRVLGLGPLIGKTVGLWELPVNFTLKYDFEFAAQNRSSGNELWLTAALRF